MDYRIFPPQDLLEANIKLPASKSLSNRVLILDAMTPGAIPAEGVADCDDTRAVQGALATDVTGSEPTAVNIGAAGTAMRFLTAYYATQSGASVLLDGSERMRHRPIGPLVTALQSLGADVSYAGEEGFPPLLIRGCAPRGGEVTLNATVSSQYVSALLMAAPRMTEGLTLTLEGEPASMPYILMTIGLMKQRGIEVERDGSTITVKPGQYNPVEYTVEADWSAAGYWYELQALTSGWVTLRGLDERSLQGDSAAVSLFADLGVITRFGGESGDEEEDIAPGDTSLCASPDLAPRFVRDLSATPDLAQTVAVTCGMLGIPFRLEGLASLRIKETDRLQALSNELVKIGVIVEIERDSVLSWDGARRPIFEVPVFDTYDDHRMAMSLAPVAVYLPGIVVRDAEVVNKSYPGFWEDLTRAGFRLMDPSDEITDEDEE